ncbi:putative Ig domain-containing protein [Rhizobium sp. KVB221]|uniref:Ig domain-containing protein n=1 Tax=Rhizobium setariae TaxID=2801340 RepID=A0A936YT46_9HYPH|nr:putative Ig domain-containing protein [Rhizobium setariae]MBL0375348.1 putative Ig domain-containing protein [Rhizobium setariae]
MPAQITSATYDAATGLLTVLGTGFVGFDGAANDIIASKFTLWGEGGATYTLTDTANVEITSSTSFTLSLGALDKLALSQILNSNGMASTGATTYNLAAGEGWARDAAQANESADISGNGITVSNIPVPTITSATYDASTGTLTVTGTGFLSRSGASNDILANKFTLTGEGSATYTLTNTANAEITSATSFTLSLSATDRAGLEQIFNKSGTSSTGGTTFNLAAGEDWANGADPAVVTADVASNGVTVSNVAVPTITSATYDASTGTLTVTGTGFTKYAGAANDIIANKFTLTGEGGATYALTDTANVDITSGTSFTLSLSATDRAAILQILNKNGTASTGSTTFNLAAGEDWANGADPAVVTADLTGNAISVSNVPVPAITSAIYSATTGALTVTGTGFTKYAGAANDIIANKLTLTGEGGATYSLTDTANVEITSGTSFTLSLSATDKAAISQILNKNGTSSTGTTTYNISAVEDWANGADPAVVTADLTGNGITVSSVAVPTITSATYDATTGALTVTGTGFTKYAGAANDIIANKLTLTGEGGATYSLTDTANVEITSGTSFTLSLSATDKAAISQILNKNGTSSTGTTTYNISAVEDWANGADPAVVTADLTGNGIAVSNVAVPTITSAIYSATTGALVVIGTGFTKLSGADNDIQASMFTLTGEGGATYTLTDTANAEITSATSFTLSLSATDKAGLSLILNKNGTASTGGTTFNLAAGEDWANGADPAVVTADLTGNGVTVSNVLAPEITSATYDASTGTLTVTGIGFTKSAEPGNDIIANKFILTGEGGATYALTDTANVEITSATSFTLSLSASDKAGLSLILNKNGPSSTGGTTFNLAATEDWANGADPAVVTADLTGNGVTVSNVAVPVITANAPPTQAIAITDQIVSEDSPFSFTLPAGTFIDTDGDALRYSATLADGGGLPSWLVFDSATQSFSGTPTNGDVGEIQVKVTASDLRSSTSDVFKLKVENENDVPTSIALSSNRIAENSANGTVIGMLTAVDMDVDDALTFSLVKNPGGRFEIVDGMLVVAEGARLDFEKKPTHDIVVRVTDSAGAFRDETFTIELGDLKNEPQKLIGDGSSNHLKGGIGNDQILGKGGNDVLRGGRGNDYLDGGIGNDRLAGGPGADTFVFGKKYGHDVISDFHPGEGDIIDLSGAVGIAGFQDLMKNHLEMRGDDLIITAADDSKLVLLGIDTGDLSRDVFIF